MNEYSNKRHFPDQVYPVVIEISQRSRPKRHQSMTVLKWWKVKVVTREEREWGGKKRRKKKVTVIMRTEQNRTEEKSNGVWVSSLVIRTWNCAKPVNLLTPQQLADFVETRVTTLGELTRTHTHTKNKQTNKKHLTTPTQFSASLSSLWIHSLYFKRYPSHINEEANKQQQQQQNGGFLILMCYHSIAHFS